MEWTPVLIEKKIKIDFKDKELLRLALMHKSYAQLIGDPEGNNQRLEFLGETLFNLIITDYFYHNFGYMEINKLKAVREKLTAGERLTKLWYNLDLGEAYPFLGLKEERHRLRVKPQNPFADALEALIAAISLDRGFSQARNWSVKNLIAPVLEKHLQDDQERLDPQKQRNLLSNALLKAIVSNYLYNNFPSVEVKRLKGLCKEITASQAIAEYNNQLKPEDLTILEEKPEKVPDKPFKALLAAIYLDYNATNTKSSFNRTSEWFINKFIDQEDLLRRTILLLLKDEKPQKWIIHNVMGYESRDYHAGRDRFNELVGEKIET